MFFDPRSLFTLVLLVGVTGWVMKGLILARHRVKSESESTKRMEEMEERLRKIEAATTSLLVDVSSMREKQRFMAKLQATSDQAPKALTTSSVSQESIESGVSPMLTQNIPIARARLR
jgi:hypothetical protein